MWLPQINYTTERCTRKNWKQRIQGCAVTGIHYTNFSMMKTVLNLLFQYNFFVLYISITDWIILGKVVLTYGVHNNTALGLHCTNPL